MKKILLTVAAALALGAGSFAQTTYFSQDFEGTTGSALPTGWSQTVAVGTPNDSVGWNTGDVTTLNSADFTPPAHTRFVEVNDDAFEFANNTNSFLMTPSINLAAATSPFLSFDCSYLAQTYGGFTEVATVEVSTDGGTTWTVVSTLAGNVALWWEPRHINLSAYAGMANVMIGFRYSDNTGWLYAWAIDNVVVSDPIANDLALTGLDQVAGAPSSWGVAGGTKTLSGTVYNNGASTVTSYNVNYIFNGGAVVTYPVTGVSIPAFTSATFTDATAITLPATAGTYPVSAWVSLTGDANAANDSATTSITVFDSLVPKTVLIEEFNQASCDPCAAATPNLDSVYANNASRSIMVRYHVNFPGRDCMDSVTLGAFVQDQLTFYNVTGVPDAQVDGAYVYPGAAGPGSMSTAVLGAAASVGSPFKIVVTPSFDAATHTYSFSAAVTSYAALPAGLTLRAALTIDKLTYAANQSTESIPQTKFPEVAENMFPNAGGQSLAAFTSGSTQTLTGSWTKDHPWASDAAVWKYDSTSTGKIVAWVQDDATGFVYQVGYAAVTTTGPEGVTAVVSNSGSMDVYPNPANKTATVALSLKENASVTMEVVNAVGQVVYTTPAQNRNSGVSMSTIDVSNFAAGQYFVKISVGTEIMTKQLTVIK